MVMVNSLCGLSACNYQSPGPAGIRNRYIALNRSPSIDPGVCNRSVRTYSIPALCSYADSSKRGVSVDDQSTEKIPRYWPVMLLTLTNLSTTYVSSCSGESGGVAARSTNPPCL